MPRHARAILAALGASVAAARTLFAMPAVIQPPDKNPPRPRMCDTFFRPKTRMSTAEQGRADRQYVPMYGSSQEEKKKKTPVEKVTEKASLSLDLYPLETRTPMQLNGDYDVSSAGTRIQMKEVLGRGRFGTVIGGVYNADDLTRTIAVKRMLSADPKEVLESALRECGAALDGARGRLEDGVVPCYGVVVGPNIEAKLIVSVLEGLTMNKAHFAGNVPVVVGGWSDHYSHGWNVALVVPWLEDVIDGNDLSFGLFPPGVLVPNNSSAMHSALVKNDTWKKVPAAIVACVTRVAKFLLEGGMWSRDMVAANLLFPPGFAAEPFAPKNCLLSGFGSVVSLKYTNYSRGGSLPYMHPMTIEFRRSASLHHATDVFNLAVDALQMLTGGHGHPLFRCSHAAAHQKVAFTIVDEYRSPHDSAKLKEVAERFAWLTNADLRGMATMSPEPCREIAARMTLRTPDESREIGRAFRERSDLYGWTSPEQSALAPTPELTQLARLFQLTGPEQGEMRPGQFINVYQDILRELLPRETL